MGLDASVGCNCLREGLAKPCAAGPVRLQEGYWVLDLPWEGNEEAHHSFDRWIQTACTHPDMGAAHEHLSNWSGYRAFQEALRAPPDNPFPVLMKELPESNDGLCPPESCRVMLTELDRFEGMQNLGRSTWLIDAASGDPLHEHVEGYEGVIAQSGRSGLEAGFDPDGIFIRKAKGGEELLRSRRVQQKLLQRRRTDRGRAGRVEFTDLEGGRKIVLKIALHGHLIPWDDGSWTDKKGRSRFRYPESLGVEERDMLPSAYGYILAPLRRLCEASVATGNPIRWA